MRLTNGCIGFLAMVEFQASEVIHIDGFCVYYKVLIVADIDRVWLGSCCERNVKPCIYENVQHNKKS